LPSRASSFALGHPDGVQPSSLMDCWSITGAG
jgi:hypothetical protein